MSEKSIISFVGRLIGLGGQTATDSSQYTCPKGHPMDPSWTSCPRCEAESRLEEKSSLDINELNVNLNLNGRPPMSHGTSISSDAPREGPQGTRVDRDDSYAPAAGRGAGPRRKITGVLVSFTWTQEGDLFTIYEGRNFIGKGTLAREEGRPCDVLMRADNTMSNEHAMIRCLGGRYQLFDQQSTNGTYVDDEFVETTGAELRDGAKIKTGATIWLFRKIESEPGVAAQSHHHAERYVPREERSEDDEPRVRDPSRVR